MAGNECLEFVRRCGEPTLLCVRAVALCNPRKTAHRPPIAARMPRPLLPCEYQPRDQRRRDPVASVSCACCDCHGRGATWSARPSRSHRPPGSSARTPRGTTAARSTAPSRLPQVDRGDATLLMTQALKVQHTYWSQCVTRVGGLDNALACCAGLLGHGWHGTARGGSSFDARTAAAMFAAARDNRLPKTRGPATWPGLWFHPER